MNDTRKRVSNFLGVTDDELRILFERRPNPQARATFLLFLFGILLTPITFFGALMGYVRGYNRFMLPHDEMPDLAPVRPIVRLAMVMGAVILWGVLFLLAFTITRLFGLRGWAALGPVLAYAAVCLFICGSGWFLFHRWRVGIANSLLYGSKFGSAKFASESDLAEYRNPSGFYLGGGYVFNGKGHMLTVAGTRGGKGTSLIIPNLLGAGNYKGSWVVIDPKGENAAITARYQREMGRKVVLLNPWALLPDITMKPAPHVKLKRNDAYNPLDILTDTHNANLVDDVQMIAEMIVPIDKQERDKFFTDNARSIVAGLILHLVTSREPKEWLLQTIWEWVRYPEEQWKELMQDMRLNDDETYGRTVEQAGKEIMKLMASGDRTWGTIIAVILQSTDFIKSPALQKAMLSGFDPKTLADGNTTVYVIIPADKLQSHSRWLRLVVTTMMRAVVRAPKDQVCFLLDEFSALGYLPEIETALSTYAGFNITVWPILQSLVQLKAHYSGTWETFIGNSTIRQFFSVNDNFTAEYFCKAIGTTSNVINKYQGGIIVDTEANQRQLITPDELRRESGKSIFALMGEKPITYYPKRPYYQIPELQKRADGNPYMK
jgi:type IV secretion system protein VirD4